jgi:hypothetical protein
VYCREHGAVRCCIGDRFRQHLNPDLAFQPSTVGGTR